MLPGRKTNKLNIAIVEDDPDIRSILSIMLTQRLGFPQPSLFNDGNSFVKALTEDRLSFDVVIMDYRMPEMNGIEAAKIIMRHRSGVKIILVTGYDVEKEARSIGLLYLQKPFSMEALSKILEESSTVS
jgi:DNA-binding NtrC family response regulator